MVHCRSKFLFPARVLRLGISTTNIAGDDARSFAEFLQCPDKIDNVEAAAFPIRHRLFAAKTIKIDRNVNTGVTKIVDRGFEMFAPVTPQNRASSLSIFRRPIVCPGMHFKNARAFSATIAENLVRPPAFEITATPNCDVLHM